MLIFGCVDTMWAPQDKFGGQCIQAQTGPTPQRLCYAVGSKGVWAWQEAFRVEDTGAHQVKRGACRPNQAQSPGPASCSCSSSIMAWSPAVQGKGWIRTHRGHEVHAGPVRPKLLGQLHEVARGSLADAEDAVLQPLHALGPQLVLEELGAQLGGQQGHILDDGQAHAPVLVRGQLLDGGQQGLRQQVDPDHLVHLHVVAHINAHTQTHTRQYTFFLFFVFFLFLGVWVGEVGMQGGASGWSQVDGWEQGLVQQVDAITWFTCMCLLISAHTHARQKTPVWVDEVVRWACRVVHLAGPRQIYASRGGASRSVSITWLTCMWLLISAHTHTHGSRHLSRLMRWWGGRAECCIWLVPGRYMQAGAGPAGRCRSPGSPACGCSYQHTHTHGSRHLSGSWVDEVGMQGAASGWPQADGLAVAELGACCHLLLLGREPHKTTEAGRGLCTIQGFDLIQPVICQILSSRHQHPRLWLALTPSVRHWAGSSQSLGVQDEQRSDSGGYAWAWRWHLAKMRKWAPWACKVGATQPLMRIYACDHQGLGLRV